MRKNMRKQQLRIYAFLPFLEGYAGVLFGKTIPLCSKTDRRKNPGKVFFGSV